MSSTIIELADKLNRKFDLVAQANEASVVLAKISNLQNIMKQLSTSEFSKEADPELLYKKFLTLQKKFNEFTKLTNAGKASPELKVTKLKFLQNWIDNYENPAQAVIGGLPKKYQNKNVTLSPQALKQVFNFKKYIPHIIEFMNKLEPRYKELKKVVSDVMEKGKTLQVHMNKFLLTNDFIPEIELFAAGKTEETEITGDFPNVSPIKMLKTIQSIISKYYKFSVEASNKYGEIENLVNELEPIDLGDFLDRTNKRNKLIQALLRDLVDINRTLYQTKFSSGPILRQKYYQLVEECVPLVPEHIANKLLAVIKPYKDKGKFQTVLDQSLEGIQQYKPSTYQSPHVTNYTPPTPILPSLEKRVDHRLINQELANISQRPGQALSPKEVAQYQRLWKQTPEGAPILPAEKAKYEALWDQ